MASINFKIRKQYNSKSIYFVFNYGRRKELRYSTGWRLNDRNNWNKEKQRVKNVISEPFGKKINSKILELETFFNKKYQELIDSRIEVNNAVLRNELNIYFDKTTTKNTATSYKSLLPCYNWYIQHFSKHPLPTTKRPLAKGTVKSYNSAFNIITEFSSNTYALNYDTITMDFYYDFLDFLEKKGFSNNYIANQIKMLKTIMNYSYEAKFHSNSTYKSKSFMKPNEQVEGIIYLNNNELDKLYKLVLSGRHEIARDFFLISSYSGLRISDFLKLETESIRQINGTPVFDIKVKKTNRPLIIPIHPRILEILNKRDGQFPRKISEQQINKALKEIGEKAEINQTIRIEKTIGGKKTIIKKKKFELITAHSGRRNFCTNAYKSGMNTIDIMAISGHRSEETFYRYIRVTEEERALRIAKHKFFN
jgi:integrase